jgi:hypothetical protein
MIRSATTRVLLFMLALLAASSPAAAQVSSRPSVIVKISADPSVGGTAIGAATGTINGAPVSINESSWADTHSQQSPLFEGGIGIGTGHSVEILALVNYGHAGAKSGVLVGTVGGTTITANFDDYNFWGAEAGVRVRNRSGLGPYLTFTGGFRHISEIQARLITTTVVRAVTGYDASSVPSLAFGGGFLFGDRSLALGIEVAVRYAGAPSAASNNVVTPASGAGARWSLPVGIVLKF